MIRPGTAADLPALTAVYNHYVEHTTATFDLVPFPVEARQGWLDQYAPGTRHQLLVAAGPGDEVLGYATSSPFRAKAAYDASVETTVYLAPTALGQGVGTALYSALLAALREVGVHRAYAGVAQPNPGSMALHARFGFREVGRFTEVGFKHGAWRDVAWLQADLD